MAFSVVLQRQLFMFLLIRGFFAKQMDLFCKAKGLQLVSKTTTVVRQKDSFCKKMKLFVSCDDCAFGQLPHNPLCISNIPLTAQNSRISHQRFSCAFNS